MMKMKNINKCLILLLMCFVSIATLGQELAKITVSGVVYDELDMTIPGATVHLKDSPTGTFTDPDGKFTLKAQVGNVLVISFIGYENYEKLITKSDQNLKIKLKEDAQQLDEVVITAMGASQRKISIVGAVTNVDVKDLQTPATSITNMLGGRVPGIISMQNSGEPGKNISEFWVRGIGTFGANSSALVLIDGLEGDLSMIDPADIESFSVLKDASATAVYGVRGANGVVLVTTKRGVTDKLKVTARANFTISELRRMPKYLRAHDYAKLANEARVVRGDLPKYSDMDLYLIDNQLEPDLLPDVNWRDEILNTTSFQQTYYVNVRGGGSMAKYFVSLGMSDESAAYKQDKSSAYSSDVGYKTYNYRANIDMNLTPTTSLYFGVDGWRSAKTEPGNANTDYLWSAQAKLTPLTIPTKYSTGELPAYGPTDEYSPYVMLNHTGLHKIENSKNTITLALNQDLNFITDGLKIKAQGAITQETFFSETRTVMPAMYFAEGRYETGDLQLVEKIKSKAASYSKDQNQFRKYHFETTLNYDKIIEEDHRLSLLGYYYMSDQKKTEDANSSMGAIPVRYQGISSRVSYGFKDTYFVDANFGYTGSENFKPGSQFGFFPSIAGGWIPTKYEFIREKLPWLSFLKIRASYGLVGNDRISDKRFPYLTIVDDNAATGWGYGGSGIIEKTIGADNLKWEKAKKFDLGIEGRLWDERIQFVVDIFNDQRDGIFQKRTQIPGYVGLIEMPFGNVGRMKSTGADGNISYEQKINQDMSFVLRGNFTYTKNMVQNWEQSTVKYPYQSFAGWPYEVKRGYVAIGLFKDEDDIANSPTQTFGKYLPGDIKYKDINGDGVIDSDDQVPLSYKNYPRLMYGFGGEFRYKKFTLGILFKGTGNNDFYYTSHESGLGYIPFLQGELGNVLTIVGDQSNRWTPASYSGDPATENPNARFPRLSYGKNENNSQISTFWKANARYLRLQEVSLNYNLVLPAFKKVGVSSIDLQFVGSNLAVWDNLKLWDPEQAGKNGSVYPIPARYAFQLYLNF